MMNNQLMLFPETEEMNLKKEIEKLKLQIDNSRKSQFGKISEMKKMYEEIRHELEVLKLNICKGRILE